MCAVPPMRPLLKSHSIGKQKMGHINAPFGSSLFHSHLASQYDGAEVLELGYLVSFRRDASVEYVKALCRCNGHP